VQQNNEVTINLQKLHLDGFSSTTDPVVGSDSGCISRTDCTTDCRRGSTQTNQGLHTPSVNRPGVMGEVIQKSLVVNQIQIESHY
jgi:hypothetical protein